MWRYIIGRFLRAIVVVFGVLVVVFLLIRISGDPIHLFIDENFATKEQIKNVREQLGLDKPLYIQFVKFIFNVLRGDFGFSYRRHEPSVKLVLQHFPATLELAITSILISFILAIPLGVWSAVKRGSLLDEGTMVLATAGQSIPVFWLGIVLIIIFAVEIGIFPTSGRGGIANLILPAITLATRPIALGSRLVRSAMLEVLDQEFIRTARAKGIQERGVVYRHALRNALIPIITIMAVEFSVLLGGAIVTETVFAWPGIGYLTVQGILMRDYPIVQTAVFFIALFVVVINFIVDLLYLLIDPRISYK